MNKLLAVLVAGLFATAISASVYAADEAPAAPAAEKPTQIKSMKHLSKHASHEAKLKEHEAKLKEHEEKHKEHEAKLKEHAEKHKEHEAKLKEHEERIKALEVSKAAVPKPAN